MKKLTILLLILGYVFSMQAQVVKHATASSRAGNPNVEIAKTLKTTGTVSLSVGVPCLAAGLACVMYANFMPDPTRGYTTSSEIANKYADRTYISTEEYVAKLNEYSNKKNAANTAGLLLAPMGGALTIIGIPLYIKGDKLLKLDINYTGNGVGASVKF